MVRTMAHCRRTTLCVVAGGLSLLVSSACRTATPPADARLLTAWMRSLYAVVRAERLSPPVASRVFAYGAIALYEGLAPGSARLESVAGRLNGLGPLPRPERGEHYDWPVVAVSAERTVLGGLFQDGLPPTRLAIGQLADSQIAARVALGVPATVRDRSIAYGTTLGQAIVAWAATDRFSETRGLAYRPPKGRQFWVNTATPDQYVSQSLSGSADYVSLANPAASAQPGQSSERNLVLTRVKGRVPTLPSVDPAGITEPYWGRLRPFVLTSMDECAPPPPMPYSEEHSSEFYRQARAVYDTSKTLTAEQREIALFWADNAGQSGTPPGHWLRIASQLVDELHLDADRSAELFMLTAVAMADAFISCWHEKFTYNVPRPVTYIRRVIARDWQTLIVTPPFPDYTPGHAVVSGAAAGVLTQLLGDRAFSDSTHINIGHPVRAFASFRAAAREAAFSRLYAGIHFPVSLEHGLVQGDCIARRVAARVTTRKSQ